jgi:hypothetical protein
MILRKNDLGKNDLKKRSSKLRIDRTHLSDRLPKFNQAEQHISAIFNGIPLQ